MTDETRAAKAAIREVVEDWVVASDSGDWERFETVWHDDAWMTATWFQGPAVEFQKARRAGFERGVNIIHFLGGTTVDVAGQRAIAQTKMTINQRASVDGIVVDAVCTGRFYDFFESRTGRWAIVRRQPIYEKDRLDPVEPGKKLALDAELLARHLGYLQTKTGFAVKLGLPGVRGREVEKLYAEGAAWLRGSAKPGEPL
jgi:ketosteroid isomerase-like protein